MVQQVIMDMALKHFTKELKNPNSAVSKRFRSMLYGDAKTGKGGLFEKFLDSVDTEKKSDTSTRSNDDIESELDRYRRKPYQTAMDITTQGLGTLAKGAGNAWNTYHGLLGDALLAVSQAAQSDGYANPFFMLPATAAGIKTKGAIGKIAGDTFGTIVQDAGSNIKNEREKEREVELLLREKPSGMFYDSRRKLTK